MRNSERKYLLLDVGNTHTVLAISDGSKILGRWRISTRRFETEDEFFTLVHNFGIDDGIKTVAISSVVPSVDIALERYCKKYLKVAPLWVNAEDYDEIKWNVNVRPSEIGADRVANVIAVRELFSGDIIVVDFGTAITVDVLVGDTYEGGAILPGFRTSIMALFTGTAKLPQVDLKDPGRSLGKDTEDNIQIGVVRGLVKAVDSIIDDIENETSRKYRIIATGGNSHLAVGLSKHIKEVDEDLTIKGILIFAKKRMENLR
ncbi:MAG TPA: type III pantothenate kinase [Thermotogales bacterium]|nr:type III pantothenate kinase [Thermotogales bacterium]